MDDKELDKYNKKLIKWVKDHYWDSLENDKDLILRHLRTFTGEIENDPLIQKVQQDDLDEIWSILLTILNPKVTFKEGDQGIIDMASEYMKNNEDAVKSIQKILMKY